jgi:hypothetical protein
MVIRRVNPLSVAKIAAVLYAVMGLIVGAFVSLLFMVIGQRAGMDDGRGGAMVGMLFGAGSIVVLPIFYGVMGGIVAAISAVLYNLIAGAIGGIEIDLEAGKPDSPVTVPGAI